jgi:hypothetical protein
MARRLPATQILKATEKTAWAPTPTVSLLAKLLDVADDILAEKRLAFAPAAAIFGQ